MTGTSDHSSVKSLLTNSSSSHLSASKTAKPSEAAKVTAQKIKLILPPRLPLKKAKTSQSSSSVPSVNAKPPDGDLPSPISVDDLDVDTIETPTTKLDVEADLSRFVGLTS